MKKVKEPVEPEPIPACYNEALAYAVNHADDDLAQLLITRGAKMLLDVPNIFADGKLTNNPLWTPLVNDDVASLKTHLNNPNLIIKQSYLQATMMRALTSKILRGQAYRTLVNAAIQAPFDLSVHENRAIFYEAIRYGDEDTALQMLGTKGAEELTTREISYYSLRYLFEMVLRKNMVRLTKVLASTRLAYFAKNGLDIIIPCFVAKCSPDMIAMLVNLGWRPEQSRSPRVADAIAAKLDDANMTNEAKLVRQRGQQLVANRIARELDRT